MAGGAALPPGCSCPALVAAAPPATHPATHTRPLHTCLPACLQARSTCWTGGSWTPPAPTWRPTRSSPPPSRRRRGCPPTSPSCRWWGPCLPHWTSACTGCVASPPSLRCWSPRASCLPTAWVSCSGAWRGGGPWGLAQFRGGGPCCAVLRMLWGPGAALPASPAGQGPHLTWGRGPRHLGGLCPGPCPGPGGQESLSQAPRPLMPTLCPALPALPRGPADQYYTRLLPSRQFDMVPDDFPYALLVLVVVALSVASLVLRRMSAARVLKWQWQ